MAATGKNSILVCDILCKYNFVYNYNVHDNLFQLNVIL